MQGYYCENAQYELKQGPTRICQDTIARDLTTTTNNQALVYTDIMKWNFNKYQWKTVQGYKISPARDLIKCTNKSPKGYPTILLQQASISVKKYSTKIFKDATGRIFETLLWEILIDNQEILHMDMQGYYAKITPISTEARLFKDFQGYYGNYRNKYLRTALREHCRRL